MYDKKYHKQSQKTNDRLGKILATYVKDKGLISLIYKESLKSKVKRPKKAIENKGRHEQTTAKNIYIKMALTDLKNCSISFIMRNTN